MRRRNSSVISKLSVVEEVMETVRNTQEAVSTAVRKDMRKFDHQLKATLLGHRTFHIAWTMYVLLLSFGGGMIIHFMTGYNFIDCLFQATSVTTGAGLSVIGAIDLPKGVFIVQGLLTFAGGGCLMLLPTLLYRCYCLRRFIPEMDKRLRDADLEYEKRIVIEEYSMIYYSSMILAVVIVVYIFMWYIFGTVTLLMALHRKPMEPELLERDFTFFDIALYTTVSAFSNSGCTLGSNSLVHVGGNSPAIFIITAIILAGNIMMPVFLHWLLDFILFCLRPFESYRWITNGIQYILDNPRKITTHLFDRSTTLYLFQVMVVGKLFLFMYFLVSNWYRETMVKYGGLGHVAGLGLFQVCYW
jgi:Trk-type K+ transport system membrane component